MNTLIVIPARYNSTRFPGKPLTPIAGKTMLARVVEIARKAAYAHPATDIAVATEDDRIVQHCRELDVECVMTSPECATGSDRVLEAAQKTGHAHDLIISLQGDVPFTPAKALDSMIRSFVETPSASVVTPVVQLSWNGLDRLRAGKAETPFTGTTVCLDPSGNALWFSKAIIPVIRDEAGLRRDQPGTSPVYRHMGIYGYRPDVLERFVSLPQGVYEKLEGLEQLRLLENNIDIRCVPVDVDEGLPQFGIDSPEDVARAEALLEQAG